MRDLLVVAIVVASLPVAVARPFAGVVVWTWLGFMNPHQLTWGFARTLELSLLVAGATLLGLVFTDERRRVPLVRETYLLAAFWALTAVSSFFGYYQEDAWGAFRQFTKILLMLFVTIMLGQTRERLRVLLIVAALSIGFWGFKGGLWVLITGGEEGWALGPDGSFIGDNNGLALALDMTLPLLFFLALEERGWLQRLLAATCALSAVTIPFTYSRGGFLGLVVVLAMSLARTRWKWAVLPAGAMAAMLAISFLPLRWIDRMGTITTYAEDGSAMSRLNAWRIGWGLALDNPFVGGGFVVFPHAEVWLKYVPEWNYGTTAFNAHSIYFQVLGEHGFTGLGLFIALLACTLLSLRAIRRQARGLSDGAWLVNYASMVQISVAAFMVAGAFYNLAYFDLLYFFVAVTIILKQLVADRLVSVPVEAPAPGEAWAARPANQTAPTPSRPAPSTRGPFVTD